jgi:RNA polymerase sigma-70 factor (sigma-E family)
MPEGTSRRWWVIRKIEMDKDGAFSEYAAARWRVLVRAGVLLGCDVAEAEDLAQQTLLRCYLKWGHVEGAVDRHAYVARVQVNLLRQARRRRWTHERPAADVLDGSVPDGRDRVDDADALARALSALPEAQRQAVVLRYYLHLTEAQIAEAAGVAPGTVKSRLSRGLAALAASPGLGALREGQP